MEYQYVTHEGLNLEDKVSGECLALATDILPPPMVLLIYDALKGVG